MGRPPCCDKVGIKKGPWTPEEDIILVSYIQEHGPGNWRAVPTNTGLLRCSKSCRLRWTNYLRPGIKRGNFTPHEEGMIIHLQALLGNKWAAIATYLPQRTDNDIKNYWNTHLKKKLKKLHQSGLAPSANHHQFMMTRANNDERQAGPDSSSVYASSAENISRLLEGWMRSSTPPHAYNNIDNNNVIATMNCPHEDRDKLFCRDLGKNLRDDGCDEVRYCYRPQGQNENNNILENNIDGLIDREKEKVEDVNDPPLSFLEKWLLDESGGQAEGVMELSSMF